MMNLHEWLTFGNRTRTHQGAEGPPRELLSLPLFTLRSLFARCERALWRHLLATYEKKNCTSRPRPNGSKTSTRAPSSEEATSVYMCFERSKTSAFLLPPTKSQLSITLTFKNGTCHLQLMAMLMALTANYSICQSLCPPNGSKPNYSSPAKNGRRLFTTYLQPNGLHTLYRLIPSWYIVFNDVNVQETE